MEGANKTEANRHKNYRLKQHDRVASLHEYCAERDAMVEFQKRMILKLRRKNKRLRNQRDRQRKLTAKRKGQEEKEEAKEESAYHAALVKDGINSGGVASNEQPISVPNFIENGKDKEMRAEKSLGFLANLEREVDLSTHEFPEEVFQDPDNSGDTQQYWKEKFQEDTMSLNPQLNLMLMHAQAEAEESRRLDLSPMADFPLMDEDLFDGRLD